MAVHCNTLFTFSYGKYFVINLRFLSITYCIYLLLGELLCRGSLTLLHGLAGYAKNSGPCPLLTQATSQDCIAKISFEECSNDPSRTKSKLTYHLPKAMDSPSSTLHSYNMCAGIYLGPFKSLPWEWGRGSAPRRTNTNTLVLPPGP